MENLQSLPETMSVEAIAAIKAKRLAMKRGEVPDGQRNSRRLLREQQLQDDEKQAEVCRRARERERQHRDREEQLLGEKELPGVLRILAKVYDSNKRRLKSKDKAPKPAEKDLSLPMPGMLREVPVVPPQLDPFDLKHSSKYNRYGQERFNRKKPEFDIDPLGSHLKADQAIPGQGHIPAKVEPMKRRSRKPIIVVPASLKSLVTLHNVKQLLQDMHYVSVEEVRQSGDQGSHEVIIERKVQGEIVRYRVIDKVSRLTNEEWERVAAVFALGPRWQFKGWPQRGDPANIFHRVCAFHLHFKNSPVHRDLENLQVTFLSLPQHERHLDCGILMEFWNKLDQHIALHPGQFAFMKAN
ncbi:hypothetical protein KR074_009151 [Drosophila pseudoananassae]|nr:hypothetical protein KR074_009151 [Drosophila pseudoananassae]